MPLQRACRLYPQLRRLLVANALQCTRTFAGAATSTHNNLVEVLRTDNDNACFFDCDSDRVWTSRQFWDRVACYARVLHDEYSLRSGDRVLCCIEKSVDTVSSLRAVRLDAVVLQVALYMAVLQLGALYVSVHHETRSLDHYISDSSPRVIIVEGDRAVSTTAAYSSSHCMVADKAFIYRLVSRVKQPYDTIDRSQPAALIMYTQGITGRPKGSIVTHDNMITNARALVERWKMTPEDRTLHMLRLDHIQGLCVSINVPLISGGQVHTMSVFDASHACERLRQCTISSSVPTYYKRMLQLNSFNRDTMANVRLFLSGNAPMTDALHEEFLKRIGKPIVERYGMSEAQILATANEETAMESIGSVGKPLSDVQIRIDNDTGEVQARGPNIFAGYWAKQGQTEQEFTEDGWLKTGDVGRFDDEGRLHIVGRIKDIILTGGLPVVPAEVERCIDGVEGVQECCVFGVPHSDLGETVVAVVATDRKDVTDLAAITQDIGARCKKMLDPHKVPKRVLYTDRLKRIDDDHTDKKAYRAELDTLFEIAVGEYTQHGSKDIKYTLFAL